MASIALDDIPAPDYADAIIVPIPASRRPIPEDPAWWASQVFSVASAPKWVGLLFRVRQSLVGLVGINRGEPDVFEIDRVDRGEALIAANDTHLDFRAAVAVDSAARLLQMTTVVRLHGWRGKLYWSIVKWFHGPVTRSMMTRAAVRFGERQGV